MYLEEGNNKTSGNGQLHGDGVKMPNSEKVHHIGLGVPKKSTHLPVSFSDWISVARLKQAYHEVVWTLKYVSRSDMKRIALLFEQDQLFSRNGY